MRTPRMVGATAGNHAGALHAMAGVVAVCSVLVDHRPDRHNVKRQRDDPAAFVFARLVHYTMTLSRN
jgi:hypothetical protein